MAILRRKIKLLDAHFQSWRGTIKKPPITVITIAAPFDQLVADQLGLKTDVFKRRDEGDAGIRGWELDLEIPAGTLVIRPNQATTDGKVKVDQELRFDTLEIDNFYIRKHKDDEQRMISFDAHFIDEDAELHQLIHAITRDSFACDVEPGTKARQKDVEKQLQLIKASEKPPKKKEAEADNETATVEK